MNEKTRMVCKIFVGSKYPILQGALIPFFPSPGAVLSPCFHFYSLSLDRVERTSGKVETVVGPGGSGLNLLPGAMLPRSLSVLICVKGIALSAALVDENSS